MPVHDLTGQQFGRLTVIERAPNNKRGRAAWLCRCICGNQTTRLGNDLLNSHTCSCGCLQRDNRIKHGDYKSAEYVAWCAMNSRCHTTSHVRYNRYGGRGITVCERWLHSYPNFLADMGRKPGPDYSLDRIDCDGNYTPENCRWATREMQDNNRTDSRLLTFRGKTQTAKQWCRETGLGWEHVQYRLKAGWPLEAVLTEPVIRGKYLARRSH